MKKLVYIIPSLEIGGVEVALMSAITELNNNFNFKLICIGKCNSNIMKNLSEKELNNIVLFQKFPFNYVQVLLYILNFKPDIIITSLWKAVPIGVFTKLIRRKTKYIEFIHNSKYFHWFDKFFSRWAIKSANTVFCDSSSAKIFIEKQGFKKPIEIISFLRFNSPQQWLSKQKISLKAMFIGRFHEQKRLDRLVILVKKLIDENLNFQVDMYGRDDGTMSLVKRAIEDFHLEKNIFLKGEIASDKVKNLFVEYDFYFQTSDVEGMAMSVVEAMQHGLICVLTNVGEIRNYAKNRENAIVISDDFNLAATVEQIKLMVNDINEANKLSYNAYSCFADKKTYPQSLIEKILNL